MTYEYSQSLTQRNGSLWCEEVNIKDLHLQLKDLDISTPFFVYSQKQLDLNLKKYKDSLNQAGIPHILAYAIKANYNPSLLRILKESGLSAVAVSGAELQLALQVGFNPKDLIYNGNGKREWEIQLAVQNECLINVDSAFDLRKVESVAKAVDKKCRVMLRLNPDIDAAVHPYLATGLAHSKFGVDESHLHIVLDRLRKSSHVELVGLHCHLGSTIDNTAVYSECLDLMLNLTEKVRKSGFSTLQYVNLGGGLGIDSKKHIPDANDLISAISDRAKASGLTLVLEPGRSLVANTCTLITSVLGCKHSGEEKYMVVDGAMTEVLRPALYKAYHHLELAEPSLMPHSIETSRTHVVGPVCECGDYLGKDRWLRTPHEGCLLAVFDVGAYCSSMSSNYNMRMRPAEILVSDKMWRVIRRAENLEDVLSCYDMS